MKTTYKAHGSLLIIISFFCAFILIAYSDDVADAVKNSINICTEVIVPSMFPLLFISFLCINQGIPDKLKKMLHSPLCAIFGLSGNCAEAIITGLCGGYNTAVKTASALYSQGKITKSEARRLAVFFTSPGLSFCINIAGNAICRSTLTGVSFFASSLISSVTSAAIYNAFRKNSISKCTATPHQSVAVSLVKSIEHSSSAMLSVCFSIVLFSGFSAVIVKLLPGNTLAELWRFFGEVTSGVMFSAKQFPLYITAFCLTFGGICIFFQHLTDIVSFDLSATVFLISRLCISVFSAVINLILTSVLRISTPVFAEKSDIHLYSHSPMGAAALLFLCAVFLINMMNTLSSVRQRQNN